LKEAKAKPKGSGTKEKKYNILEKLSRLRQEVIDIIEEELEYVSGFFHYDLRQFFNTDLIYFNAVYAFFKGPDPAARLALGNGAGFKSFLRLIAGIELLSIGLSIHSFDIDGLRKKDLSCRDGQDKDKRYTVELLFGDIFYSRAVIYLLDLGDYIVFNEILTSLKTVHRSRLALHHLILESSSDDDLIEKIIKRPPFLHGMGELFRTSFLIGLASSLPQEETSKLGKFYKTVSLIVTLKTFDDLEKLFSMLCLKPGDKSGSPFFNGARTSAKTALDGCLESIEEPLFRENLRSISETFI
jgi:hypothetical protein